MKQFALAILLCISTFGISQNTADKRVISVYGVAEKTTQTTTYKTDVTLTLENSYYGDSPYNSLDELLAKYYEKVAELNIDKSKNDDKVLTFHDSCNVARGSRMGDKPGGQFDFPRNVIKAVCNNYVDMHADTIKDATFCCGGGGGILTDDLMDIRVKGAQPRMEALKNVAEEKGVTHMAAICAICKSQFTKVVPYYGFSMDMIVSVHQLVSNAIVLTGQTIDEENNKKELDKDNTENDAIN